MLLAVCPHVAQSYFREHDAVLGLRGPWFRKAARASTTMHDVDTAIAPPMLGFESMQEYYESSSSAFGVCPAAAT